MELGSRQKAIGRQLSSQNAGWLKLQNCCDCRVSGLTGIAAKLECASIVAADLVPQRSKLQVLQLLLAKLLQWF